MPVEFLTDEQVARFGRFADQVPSQSELERFFFLDDADRALVRRHRGEHNRLGFSIQLGTVRFLETFLPDPLEVPTEVVDFLASQLVWFPRIVEDSVMRLRVWEGMRRSRS